MNQEALAPARKYATLDACISGVNEYFASPAARDRPFELFAALHEKAPLVRAGNAWFATGYEVVNQLGRDARLSRWEAAKTELSIDSLTDPESRSALNSFVEMLINRDGEDHARLRKLIRHAFLPGAVARWLQVMERVTEELIDRVSQKAEFDLVKEVAFPLPEYVICELLGVPHEDHDLWSEWSHTAVSANRTPAPVGDELRRVQEAYINFHRYFEKLVEERRANPGDDLMSLMIKAEEDGDKLSMDELIGAAILLIQAGQETTANLIANGMYLLLKSPEKYRQLAQDPSLVPAAVLELLRLDSPAVMVMPRIAIDDVECVGQTIRKGDHVMLSVYATGYDPHVFPEPHEMKFDRPNNNRSLNFGVGIHSCLGRQFA